MTDELNQAAEQPDSTPDERLSESVAEQVGPAPEPSPAEAAVQPAAEAQPEQAAADEPGSVGETEASHALPEAGAPQGDVDAGAAEQSAAEGDDAAIVVRAAPKPASKPARRAKKAEAPPVDSGPKSENMQWYILKVQSNREESIKDGLLRRVRRAGLDQFFGEVIVPVERVTEVKGGKKRVTKRKLYPGYLVVQMEINEDSWFLVRETPGIGDFTGASGHPTPMLPHEVNRILARQDEKTDEAPKLDIKFRSGDRVKINEGTFENFEGEVESIDLTTGRVTVMINIFGRSTPVELGYWQIESV